MSFKKNSTLEILELLTKLDFFFAEEKISLKEQSLNIIKTTKILKESRKYLFVLEPISFLKDLKRVIRLFQFINKNSNLYGLLSVKNDYFFDYLNFLLKKNLKDNEYFFLKKNIRINNLKPSHINFFFDYSIDYKLYSQLFLTKKYLFCELNSSKNLNDLGFYRLFVNFNNPKKIVFFVLLLKSLQNKNYEN